MLRSLVGSEMCIRDRSEEVDAFRQPIQTLAPVLTVGANVSQLPARERENFGLSSSNASVRVRVRGSTTVRTIGLEHVMTIGGRNYDIVGVDDVNLGNREFIFVGELRR